MSLTLKGSLKNKIFWWAYVLKLNMLCLNVYSMKFITNFTIRTLFWEAEIFLKCVLRMQEMLFQRPKYYPGGRARKMGPYRQFCPTTEESLKNALQPGLKTPHVISPLEWHMSVYFSYVLQLISLVNKTLNVKVNACTKLETPYGMELRWRLPGGMHFHIHLKDNQKVLDLTKTRTTRSPAIPLQRSSQLSYRDQLSNSNRNIHYILRYQACKPTRRLLAKRLH
jgi:hypothetical protein